MDDKEIGMAEKKRSRTSKTPVVKKTKKNGQPYPSSTGKVRGVAVDQTGWRRQLQTSRIKFDDEQKATYIEQLSLTGLKGRSARMAGVCPQLILNHIKIDPEFADAYSAAMDIYRDSLANEVRRRGRDGWQEPVFNKDGRAWDIATDDQGHPIMQNIETGALVPREEWCVMTPAQTKELLKPFMVPASIRKFSDRMLELDIKRVDPEYRDKQTVDLNHAGGVMIAPAEMTPEQWIQEQESNNAAKESPAGK